MEQVADMSRVLAPNAQFLAHLMVEIFRERLRLLDAESVEIEIPGLFAALK